jgi:CBS domain-containing protein
MSKAESVTNSARAVRDLMSVPLVTCGPSARLGDVATILRQHRIHAVVVADGSGPVGIVSDIDMLAGEWLAGSDENLATMRKMTAGELMSKPIEKIDAGAPLAEAARRMSAGHISRLLVTDRVKPVGVLSVSDLVAAVGAGRAGRRRVSDVMSWGVVACGGKTTIAAAARLMTDRRSRSVVVVDRLGRAAGMVTGTDLLLCLAGELDPSTPVTAVMKPPIGIAHDATLAEAADLMLDKEIHRLLVTDSEDAGGFPLGLIATSDIVAEMADPGGQWR